MKIQGDNIIIHKSELGDLVEHLIDRLAVRASECGALKEKLRIIESRMGFPQSNSTKEILYNINLN